MKYYIGPIPWVVNDFGGHFSRPAGTLGMIDLGSVPSQAIAGSDRPVCVCWTSGAVLPSEYALLGDGDCRELAAGNDMRSAFQSLAGYRPRGDRLVELIYDCLVGGSDPDGSSGPLPLMPSLSGWLDLYMAGHSRVLSERFEWGRPGSRGNDHTPKIKHLLRKQFAELMDDAQKGRLRDREHHRRVLDFWCEKFGLQGAEDWRELVPQALQQDVPGRLKHETTITDNFNAADSATPGNTLTWSEVSGAWSNNTNQLRLDSGASANRTVRADSDLSSSDHYGQVKWVSGGTSNRGVTARFSGSAETAYVNLWRASNSRYDFFKVVTGTYTLIASGGASSLNANDVLKISCNGSSITGSRNGSTEWGPTTDSSIAGNTRGGVYGVDIANVFYDDFEAADLSAVGIVYTQLERGTRGLMRGMYTRFD